MTAPTPVTTTGSTRLQRATAISLIASLDGLDLGHVGALQLDAELLVDDLRELGEVQRVDVERLEGRLAG